MEQQRWKLRPLATAEVRVALAAVSLTLVSLAVAFAAPYTVGALISPFPLLVLVVCTILVPDLFTRSWKEGAASALIPLLAWFAVQPMGGVLYILIAPVAAFFGAVGGWLGDRRASKKARREHSHPGNRTASA
jgi:hypothetical protein